MWFNKLFLLTSGEPSLIEELWEYLEGKYFSVDVGRYEHISIGSGSLITLQKVVLGICFGLILAAGMVCYNKNRLGAIVRKIVKEQAFSPEKAMTLEELGFSRNGGVKASLRSPNKLGRVIHCVEKERYQEQVEAAKEAYIAEHGNEEGFFMPEYRMDMKNDHFYIPDELHYRAEIRFENRGSGWRAFILVCIIAVISAALICFLLPDMLQLVDNLIGILTENDRYV